MDCISLQSVKMSDNVKTIEESAFSGCKSLESIIIGNEVETIGKSAFKYCTSLKYIMIPDKVKEIQSYTFSNCHNLKYAIIGDSVKTLGTYSFESCTSLTTLYIGSSFSRLNDYAFYKSRNVSNVIFTGLNAPGFVKNAISSCINLKRVKVNVNYTNSHFMLLGIDKCIFHGQCGKNVKWAFNNISNSLTIYGNGEMDNYSEEILPLWNEYKDLINEIIIEDGINNIGNYAFADFNNLTTIHIPQSITSIGTNIFLRNKQIQNIEIDTNNELFISLDNIIYSKDFAELIYYSPFKNETSFTIPGNVKIINDFAFSYCNNLISLIIDSDLSFIGDCAFYKCDNITLIKYYGTNEPKHGSNIFIGCDLLKSVFVQENYLSNSFSGIQTIVEAIPESSSQIEIESSSNVEFVESSTSDNNIETSFNYAESSDNGEAQQSTLSDSVVFHSSSNEFDDNDQSSNSDQNYESNKSLISSDDLDSKENYESESSIISNSYEQNTSNDDEHEKSVISDNNNESEDLDKSDSSNDLVDSNKSETHETTHYESSTSSNVESTIITMSPTPDSTPSLPNNSIIWTIPDDISETDFNQKLVDQFNKITDDDNTTDKVILINSTKITFNMVLEDNQFISSYDKNLYIDFRGGNLNLLMTNSSKIGVSLNDNEANLSINGEGELNIISLNNAKSKSINLTSNSQISGPVEIKVPDEIESITLDSVELENNGAFNVKSKTNEKPINIFVKNLSTVKNAKPILSNITILNSIQLVQSSTINIENVTLNNTIITFEIIDFENNWSPFINGNFVSSPSRLVLEKVLSNKESHPINNAEYALVSGLFNENECDSWLEKIDFNDSGFNSKSCVDNQLLSMEDQRIILKSTGSNGNKNKLGAGQIAGIVIGVIAGVALIGVAVFFLVRKCKNKDSSGDQDSMDSGV